MTKVIPSSTSFEDDGFVLDADAVARELERRMADRFGGEWTAVVGGEASGEWNLLVRGNGYELPTRYEAQWAAAVVESLVCDYIAYWLPCDDEEA